MPDGPAQPIGGHPRRLRVALIGAGLVGQAGHAPSLADDPDRWDWVAVVDPSRTVREAVAARYAVPNAVASLDEALGLGLDAVVIAVPDPAHLPTILTALAGGCHVLCEKPLGLSVAEADAVLAARGDRVVQVGYMKLYDPSVERLVERLDGGEIAYLSVEVNDPGHVPFVDHVGLVTGRDVPAELIEEGRRRHHEAVREALGAEPDGAQERAFDAYLSSLVHDVSLAHFILGSVGIRAPLPLADAAYFDRGEGVSLDWALPGGGRAHLEHLTVTGVPDYRERLTVYARDRILELTFPSPYLRHFPTRLVERRGDGSAIGLETIEHHVSYEEAFRNELRSFHDAITLGTPVRSTVEAARDDLAALIGAFRLAVTRQPASA